MTRNKLVKLTMLWTTGPWTLLKYKTFPSTNYYAWNVCIDEKSELLHVFSNVFLVDTPDNFHYNNTDIL